MFSICCSCCIKSQSEKISNIKPFIDNYVYREIIFSSHKKKLKKLESNNKLIPLNILYVPYNTEEIKHAYKSKHNLTRKN